MITLGRELYLLALGLIIASAGIVAPLAFANPVDIQKTSAIIPGNIKMLDQAPDEGNGTLQQPQTLSDSESIPAGAQSFDANGTINAVTYVSKSLKFDLKGEWAMKVRDGSTVQFDAIMAVTPSSTTQGKAHTHELLNFEPSVVGVRDINNNFFTNGTIDIGTNNNVVWTNVPVIITITDGSSIIISVDDNKSAHHFAMQPIIGTVESITDCSTEPGAAMSIESVCQSGETEQNGTTTESGTSSPSTENDSSSDGDDNKSAASTQNRNGEDTTSKGGDGQITVSLDSDRYAPNETPHVSGKVNNPVAGTVVQVDVSDSRGKIVYNTVAGVGSDGNFFTTLKEFSPGHYSVVATYHGDSATAEFEVIEPR
jgi:hypothetical protein